MNTYLESNENFKNIDDSQLKEIAKVIKNGGIVVFPTETVYGIGVNGLDRKAVERLYKVKERTMNKPISLLVSDIDMIENIAEDITDIEYKIMEKFFPGPLTIILKKKDIVPDVLTAKGDTVGVRMPEGKIARKLVEYAGIPIATSSANISGKPSGTNINDIKKDFEGIVDCFIDGGESKLGVASTIVKITDGVSHILREGSITKGQIDEVILNTKK